MNMNKYIELETVFRITDTETLILKLDNIVCLKDDTVIFKINEQSYETVRLSTESVAKLKNILLML